MTLPCVAGPDGRESSAVNVSRRRVVLTVGMVILLGLSGSSRITPVAAAAVSGNPFRTGRTLVIPHGGGDGLYPENTIVAYEKSLALGGQVVDVDIALSADGIPIAFHDSTLERTTNGTGSVAAKSYAQLATLDAGWKFLVGGKYPFRRKGVRIPTLEAVLKRFPTTLVTLDVKVAGTDVVAPLCLLLTKLGRTNDVYVGLDYSAQVKEFRRVCPGVRTSATEEERRAMRAAREAGDATFVTKQLVSQPRFRADDGTWRITPEYLAFSHSKGIAVLTWVVNDPNDMRKLIELGVDGVYTSRPDVMVKLLREMSKR